MKKLIAAMVLALLVALAAYPAVGYGQAEPGEASGAGKDEKSAAADAACEDGEAGKKVKASDLLEGASAEGEIDLSTCQIEGAVVEDEGGIGAAVPEPGEGVFAEALDFGGAQEFGILVDENGATATFEGIGQEEVIPAEAGGDTVAATAVGACNDSRYAFDNARPLSGISYYYNRATTPSELGGNEAEDAVVKANQNITGADNDCGLADNVSATGTYLGNTSLMANVFVSSTGTLACGPRDGSGVVSFGSIRNGTLAAQCSYTSGTAPDGRPATVESDIEINSGSYSWTTNPDASGCSNKFDVQDTVTHEFGHGYGLDHVTDSKLTMSGDAGIPCNKRARTLGLGDVRGLEAMY